jgi:hypothetical protein
LARVQSPLATRMPGWVRLSSMLGRSLIVPVSS